MGASLTLAVLRFAVFILWLLAFPMNGFLLEKAVTGHDFLFFIIPHAAALFISRYLVASRLFPLIANTAIGITIAGTALFPVAENKPLLLSVLGVAAAGLLIKTVGGLQQAVNPPLAGAMGLAGGNLALLAFIKLPLAPSTIFVLLAVLLLVPLFSPTPRCGETEKSPIFWYLPFLFAYNMVSGLMYGALMPEYGHQAYIGGIELLFYAGMAAAGVCLVHKGKDLLLVLGILGGMLSFSIFLLKGVLSINLSMFAFQGSAGFVDIFILVLLFSRTDCLKVVGTVFGTVCAGIVGGYSVSCATGGATSTIVGAANLFLTLSVIIFIFYVRKWGAVTEKQPATPERALPPSSCINLTPTLKKRLSVQEQAVLNSVLRKKTFRETAEDLSLSESSVKTYMKRIYEKAGVTSKEELFTVLAIDGDSAGGKENFEIVLK